MWCPPLQSACPCYVIFSSNLLARPGSVLIPVHANPPPTQGDVTALQLVYNDVTIPSTSFNSATGIFTAPHKGIYRFTVGAVAQCTGSNGIGDICLRVNGTPVRCVQGSADQSNDRVSLGLTATLTLNCADQVGVAIACYNGPMILLTQNRTSASFMTNWFEGQLLVQLCPDAQLPYGACPGSQGGPLTSQCNLRRNQR